MHFLQNVPKNVGVAYQKIDLTSTEFSKSLQLNNLTPASPVIFREMASRCKHRLPPRQGDLGMFFRDIDALSDRSHYASQGLRVNSVIA